jgi:hypothetical protein
MSSKLAGVAVDDVALLKVLDEPRPCLAPAQQARQRRRAGLERLASEALAVNCRLWA